MDFDFLALMQFDMTFDVTLRDNSSFRKLANSCNFTLLVTFSIMHLSMSSPRGGGGRATHGNDCDVYPQGGDFDGT